MTERPCASMTRRAVLMAGGAGLGTMAGIAVRTGLTQETEVPAVVQRFLAGWEAMDPARIAQTFAADGRREDITSPVAFQGHDEIRRSLTDFFAVFNDASVEHPQVLAGPGPFAADTWDFTGVYVGTLPGFPAGEGQRLTIRGFTLIELAGDLIARTIDYYDAASLLAQIQGGPEATPVGDQAVHSVHVAVGCDTHSGTGT